MDLINDLGNDLACALFIENRHSAKLRSKEMLDLIDKIREVLEPHNKDLPQSPRNNRTHARAAS